MTTLSFTQWISNYDNLCEAAVAAMAEKYKDVRMTYDEWERKMDELCSAHPEWAEDN